MSSPLAIPALQSNEIHLWIVSALGDQRAAAAAAPLLSSFERERAARMDDPRSFVIGRAGVRAVLAHYAALPAERLEIAAGRTARPSIAGAPDRLDFSFSRCSRLHVCAVTIDRRVGVDVEIVDAASSRAAAGLRTKRDAMGKALGADLRGPASALAVPAGRQGAVRGPFDGPRGWWVCAFDPADDVVGALAADGRWSLRQMAWPGLP
jgi:4'-phosphopantetheinyl transferase